MKKLSTLFILMAMALATFADPDIFTVSCSNGNVFTISRTDASAASWVEYYTQSGSAVAGIHYEDVAGRLDFAAGESSKIVTVPLYSVSSADKYYIDSDDPIRYFNFCVHNNSMPATKRSIGTWNNGTYISSDDITITRQQTICGPFVFGNSIETCYYKERDIMCPSTIAEAFTNSDYTYYTLSEQTPKYAFNVQYSFRCNVNQSHIHTVGITLDGHSSIPASPISMSGGCKSCLGSNLNTPNGINDNLVNVYYSSGFYVDKTYTIPTTSGISDISYRFNPTYSPYYSNGWFVDMEPTKHIGLRFLSTYESLSDVMANVKLYDKTAPVITNTYVNVNHIYTSGERVYVAVRFNEPVTGSVSSATVSIGSREFTFYYSDGLNTNTLYFYSDLSLNCYCQYFL